jgi:hypothetical protein
MTDALDDWPALLGRTGAHPPEECADPYGCEAHSALIRDYADQQRRDLWDANAAEDSGCTCPYTPESTWLYASQCGYGGGIEPGSMQEFDPACPAHACRECGAVAREVESFDEQIGYEEKARPVRVTALECGHEVVRPRGEVW